tara:strand:+ start:488 stop:2206 length:1719 start_codon:yes stop_codon:yes gene_type:complete
LEAVLKMNILGISCYYHDSAAALIQDGNVIAAVEEERFTRKKFDDEFPKLAIDYCLQEGKIKPKEIDCVAFYDKSVLKFERLLDNYLGVSPRGIGSFMDVIPKWLHKRLWIKDDISNYLKDFNGKIVFPEHHLSHAAYSYYTSDFTESAILTVDGVGEWTTTSFGKANNTKIEITNDIRWPHSLGLFYSAFTYFLGFKVNEGEYKLMGLSSFGEPKYYDLIMNNLIDVKKDGSIRLNMKYFAYTYDKVMTNEKFSNLFNCSVRKEDSEFKKIHFDIGASVQLVLEEILLKMVNHVYQETKLENLCLGGGVALNGVANNRILNEGPFKKIFIPPAPGDAGSAIGCALYAYYNLFNKERIIENKSSITSQNIFSGPSHSNDEILIFLKKYNIPYKKIPDDKLTKETAKIISEGNVVGWYQNRMEWGPRALGNRSILADPRREEMKDIVNEKIKHRERFRPFAPSILEEFVNEYFELDIPSPYMLLVSKVKKPELIPAVTHIDGTGRVQTVSKEVNSLYYDLISEFYKLTNIPVLLNTSMNVRGEPIVNTPEEAFSMILKTDMDYIIMGNYLIQR